jgi:voltage-gated potassium channel
LGLVRVVRLIRFFRLFRLIGVSGRAITALGAVLGRTGFVYVASISLIVVLAGGASLALLEPQTVHGGFGEGVWWAIVTATTVGYGDIAPVTFWGRAIAVLLMVTGVGLMSTLAASITAHFLAHEENSEVRELREQMDRIERLLMEVHSKRVVGD